MGRLLLKNPKYGQSLLKMGVKHGKGFDCMSPQCQVCKPYREKEKEEWELMTEEEKSKKTWGIV